MLSRHIVCSHIVFWSPGCSIIPVCSLVSCQLCLCVTGCLIVYRLLWVVHWKQLPLAKKKKPLWDHREWSETAKFAGRTFKAPFMRLQSQLIIVCGAVLTSEIANSFIINILCHQTEEKLHVQALFSRQLMKHRSHAFANLTQGCYLDGSSTF